MLSFEFDNLSEKLEIHGDKEGLLRLAKTITDLANKSESEHCHLMTSEWGGGELDNDKQGLENVICDHVKIFFWKK